MFRIIKWLRQRSLGRNNSIAGLEERATELKGFFREATTDEDRARYSKEIDKIGG